ncbi:cation transporter [Flavobacterium psychrophilum]|nr:cation transporter [Flavobacterium psychrophilum]AOE51555.1 cation transporter [Flavobacterium psychrophilum]
MNKLIKGIIGFSLRNKLFTFFWIGVVVIAGIISYKNIPVEAFPDVTNTQIIIVTQWPGRSAEEVERFVTSPVEIAMNSVQKKENVRSVTMFGLSVIKIIFDDDVDDFFARQQVNNQLKNVQLPDDVDPEVQPPYGPTGEIFRYTLNSKEKDTRELLTIQNWVIDRQLRAVPGIADVVAFGGREKTYEVEIDPILLQKYELSSPQVYEAISNANVNVGGDIIEKNGQAYVVRGIGLLDSRADIENTIVAESDGNPILIKNIAKVTESNIPRVGQAGLNDNDDVVEGIVVMRKNENPSEVLERLKEKIEYVQANVLPKDVKMETFYDRDRLMEYCTHTVTHNLVEGIILVTVIVFLFMADWRTTLIVSIIIPLSLLFAFLCLKMKGMSANLLSLGAVDFGIIIDGAVVMVEGLFVTLDQLQRNVGVERFNKLSKLGLIRKAGSKLGIAIFFSKLIIISALLPIFSFEKVEGKMFSPLAWTLGFALLGALLFTLTLVPVLCSILLNKNVKEKHNVFVEFFNKIVAKGLNVTFKNKKISIVVSVVILVVTLFSTRFLGSEFLPPLNEGALWVTAELPISNSLTESVKMAKIIRKELKEFPEVDDVLSQTGRSNDGTDPNGFGFLQFQVDLKPKDEWTRGVSQDELIEEMNHKLSRYQGITWNYSQPVIDNVAEAVAGFKASNAVKIYGDDLQVLDRLANEVMEKIKHIDGVKDVGVLRNLGQPGISVKFDEEKMALYGVQKNDAQSIIEMAIGGKTATQKYEGEKKFDIRLRYQQDYRKDEQDIMNLMVPTLRGTKVPLKEIATLTTETGPALIYRDNTKRFIGVKFSVRDRDLGSTIADAQAKVKAVKVPEGYSIGWTGEYENQIRASGKLAQVVPISLVLIFVLLFVMFGNIKDSLLVLVNVPFAVIGGILALHLTGINFGISAGVGFIALLGICIQNGVILVSEFHTNLKNKLSLTESIIEGVKSRTRPVVMTALMAAIGLMPAALSTGIGSESQKPLAVSIIGGLVTATVFTLLVFPNFFYWAMRKKHQNMME